MSWSEVIFAVGLAGRVCVGLVFLTAALGKLRHGPVFEGVLANYRILPRKLTPTAAATLPWVELGLGVCLLAHVFGGGPPAVGIVLLLVFAWAMAVNIRRGRSDIDCGCHQSALRQPLRWSLVGRNLVLAVLLAVSLPTVSAGGAPLIVVGVLGGVCGYVLYLSFNAIAALPRSIGSVA